MLDISICIHQTSDFRYKSYEGFLIDGSEATQLGHCPLVLRVHCATEPSSCIILSSTTWLLYSPRHGSYNHANLQSNYSLFNFLARLIHAYTTETSRKVRWSDHAKLSSCSFSSRHDSLRHSLLKLRALDTLFRYSKLLASCGTKTPWDRSGYSSELVSSVSRRIRVLMKLRCIWGYRYTYASRSYQSRFTVY